MQVKQVMSKKPEYLPPDTTLKQAAEEMYKHDFGFIPIGENDRLIGTVTDRDIAIRATAKGKDPNSTRLKEVMTKKVFYCYEDDDVLKAADSMSKQHVHRLMVLNKGKRLTGIISLGDIARKCRDEKIYGRIIETISHH